MSIGTVKRRGFSLAEVAMASAVLAVGASAVLGVVSQVGARRADSVARSTGVLLASDLLTRIAILPLADPQTGVIAAGLDAGESAVTDFDDATDFAGYNEPTIVDAGGAERAGMEGFTREAEIEWLLDASGSSVSLSPTSAARITVIARWRGKPVAKLTTIRSAAWDGGKP